MDDSEYDSAHQLFHATFTQHFLSKGTDPILLKKAWEFASGLNYNHTNIPANIYLNHPSRVTSIIAKYVPDATEETFIIALLHNAIEVSQVPLSDIQQLFGEMVAYAIKNLTIDRNRHDRYYLREYYSCIEATSLECSLVKVADKLDNIYMLCFNPSEKVRTAYLDEIDRYVIPLALKVAPQIGSRLKDASIVMKELGFLNKETELEKVKEM